MCDFISRFLLCSFLQWNWKMSIIAVIETILVFCDPLKTITDLNMHHPKMSDLFHFHCLAYCNHKTGKFIESHWHTLIFLDRKRYGVRFEYVPWKNVWFCFISVAWVYFSHKTKKIRFWRWLKHFNYFW